MAIHPVALCRIDTVCPENAVSLQCKGCPLVSFGHKAFVVKCVTLLYFSYFSYYHLWCLGYSGCLFGFLRALSLSLVITRD